MSTTIRLIGGALVTRAAGRGPLIRFELVGSDPADLSKVAQAVAFLTDADRDRVVKLLTMKDGDPIP